jgi:hypothetical protein
MATKEFVGPVDCLGAALLLGRRVFYAAWLAIRSLPA